MRTRPSRRSATQKPVAAESPPRIRKRESLAQENEEDEDESKVELDVTPRKKRTRVIPPATTSATLPKAGRGRPRKVMKTPKVEAQEDLPVEVVEDAEYIPSIAELENRAIYKSYSKLKVGTDGSKPGFTPEEMTFAVGDTCVLRRPSDVPQAKDEWICRIERIRAQDANNVYCVIRWFYTSTQATEDLHLPQSHIKDMGCDEIFASDHLEVIDVLTVDAHVKVNFGPELIGKSEYNYTKKVVLGTSSKKASAVSMKDPLLPPDSAARVTLL